MRKTFYFILRHPKLTLFLLSVVIFASVVWILSDFSISSDVSSFFPQNSKVNTDLNVINAKYHGSDTVLIALVSKDILSKNNLKKVYSLLEDLKKIKDLNYIESFAPTTIVKSLVFIPINSQNVDKTYNGLVDYIKANNKGMYTKDAGLLMLILKKSASDTNKDISNIISLIKKYKFKYHMTGNEVVNYYIFKYLSLIFSVTIPLTVLILLITFSIILGSFKAAIISLIPSALATIVTIAIIFVLGGSLSLITIIVPLFIIVVGSAEGMHFVSHFIHNKKRFKNDDYSNIIETTKMVGVPIILTAVTTMAGFLSLLTSQLSGLKQVGYYSAIGIGLSAVITLIFLVVVLSKLKIKYHEHKDVGSFLVKFFHFIKFHKRLTLTFFVLSAIVVSIFIPKVKIVSDETIFFKANTEIIQDTNYLNHTFGFSHILLYDYRTDSKNVLYDGKIQNEVLSFEKKLLKVKGVSYVMSFYDIKNRILSSVSQPLMKKFVLQRMIEGKVVPVDQWVYKGKDLKILVKLSSIESTTFDSLIKLSSPNVVLTGEDYIFYLLNKNIVRDQIISLVFALLFVFVLLMIFNRSVVISLVSLLPILYTLLVFFSFLYFSGFNLNIVIAIIASIVVGIGIDYSIHIVGGYKYYKDIDKTIDSVGIPVIANSLGMAVGLSPMIISPLRIHSAFAISVGFAMIVSSFSSMGILPILIEKIYFRRKNVSKTGSRSD